MPAQIDLRTHTALQSCPRTTAYKELCPRRQCILDFSLIRAPNNSLMQRQQNRIGRSADSGFSLRLFIFSPRPHRVMTPPPRAESGLQSRVATRALHHGCIYSISRTHSRSTQPRRPWLYILDSPHTVSPPEERGAGLSH
jgi:hypothetical protein